MDANEQLAIQEHFERMYQADAKPWRSEAPELALGDFLEILGRAYPKAKILDLGCGDGWIAIHAAKSGFPVWGIDTSPTAIRQAEAAAEEAGVGQAVEFRIGDALDLPYRYHFFDAIIDRGLFHYIRPENHDRYFENVLKILSPPGLAYLSVFSTKNPKDIGQRYTPEAVHELFGRYFKILKAAQDHFNPQAPAHLMHFILERAAV